MSDPHGDDPADVFLGDGDGRDSVEPGGTAATRLIPRWYVVTVVGGLALFTGVLVAAAAAFADGLAGAPTWGLAACSAMVLVAAASALVRPRRRREPDVTRDGSRVFRAPSLTVWPLVGAWIALLLTAAGWLWLALTDFGSLESPGASMVVVVGAVASVPDLVRLLTGRLHRWTLTIGPEQLTYRGYRSDVVVPWKDVRGAAVQDRGPAGVRIDLRSARTDPVVPIAAFDVPAEQLAHEINRAGAASGR